MMAVPKTMENGDDISNKLDTMECKQRCDSRLIHTQPYNCMDTLTDSYIHTYEHMNKWQTGESTNKQTNNQTNTHTYKQAHTNKHTNKQTNIDA